MSIKLDFDSFIHAVNIVNRTAKGTVNDMKEVADAVGEEITALKNKSPESFRADAHVLGARLGAAFGAAKERLPAFQQMVEERLPAAPVEALKGFVDGLHGRPLTPS